jgi:uncharacterized membrane protein (DUF2068 family)
MSQDVLKPNRPLRAIALLEGAKGIVVLLAGFGVLAFLHRDFQYGAEELVRQFHLNPASRYPRIFVEAAAHVTGPRLWHFAFFAFLYASLRFIEAYGLWRERAWAEWFAISSSGIYLPIEIYELLKGVTWQKVALTAINLFIFIYLARIIWQPRRLAR